MNSVLYHPVYNPDPDDKSPSERREEYMNEQNYELFQQCEFLKHELQAYKQSLKESVDDNEKYRRALLHLANYVLPRTYAQDVFVILGYTKEGLDET
jgi:hypothetical protein